MKRVITILVIAVLSICSQAANAQLNVTDLKCEYLVNPEGIDVVKPRLSWIVESKERGQKQTAYQVLVAGSKEKLAADKGDFWNSKKVKSGQTLSVVYKGKGLKSRQRCFWKVKVWDKDGKESCWSEPAQWSMGLLKKQDWQNAKWIGLDGPKPTEEHSRLSARMLRRDFEVKDKVKRATAYVCGLGMFELYINGEKAGDTIGEPALTMYTSRLMYVTIDVTEMVKQGGNAVGAILGNGRYYTPRLTVPFSSTLHFGHPKMLLQMRVEYENGKVLDIISDEKWKLTSKGPIIANNEYDGEEYDARLEMPGWCKSGFDDSGWQKAEIVAEPGGKLVSPMFEPIRVTETISPVKVTSPKPGLYIYDMGQNIVGWVRLKVSGPRGTKVSMRFAESLKEDGTLYLNNLRGAKVNDIYILKGESTEVWEPRFISHGFRYVELTGYPGRVGIDSIEGRVSHTDLERIGRFSCSNELINKIYSNYLWGTRGNYRSIPLDCPQRAERQGWLGDPAERARGENYNFGASRFFAKWMDDIEDAQKNDGTLPNLAPAYYPLYTPNVTWPSAYVIIPGWIYELYGDKSILEKHYPSMKKWMNLISTHMKDDILPLDKYGDWCVPPESPKLVHSKDPARRTAGELLGTAYFYHNLRLMAEYARILGKKNDAKNYNKTAEKIKAGFNKKFFNKKTGLYSNGTQTSSVLPLAFDMVPEESRQLVLEQLVKNILVKSKGHVGTGLIGSQWLMRVLSDNGRADIAYLLTTQRTYPSLGYMIEQGATTIWELWNGDTANPSMNSRNHLMLMGDTGTWYYENLAGIKPAGKEPAFKEIVIRPQVCGDLTHVSAEYKSVRGLISSAWKLAADKFNLDVTIPANTSATVYIPTADVESITEGGNKVHESDGVVFIRVEKDSAVYAVGSGSYEFAAKGVKAIKYTGQN